MIEDPEDDSDGLEDKAYDEQYEFIKKACGKRAAENANYGWAVTGTATTTTVGTKVYGCGVLESVIDHEAGTITHGWC